MLRLRSVLPVAVAITAASMLLPVIPAHAGLVDVWSTYTSIDACKTGLLDLNDSCFGLADGRAIGLVDANVAVDDLDHALGVSYDDENVVPAPESATNPVVEVWNNTSIVLYLGPGTSLADDVASGDTIYYVPPETDLRGTPLDIVGGLLGAAPVAVAAGPGSATLTTYK